MKKFILRLLGKKQIVCNRCKQVKTVPKDHHWLKMCLDCQKRFKTLINTVKEAAGLSK